MAGRLPVEPHAVDVPEGVSATSLKAQRSKGLGSRGFTHPPCPAGYRQTVGEEGTVAGERGRVAGREDGSATSPDPTGNNLLGRSSGD